MTRVTNKMKSEFQRLAGTMLVKDIAAMFNVADTTVYRHINPRFQEAMRKREREYQRKKREESPEKREYDRVKAREYGRKIRAEGRRINALRESQIGLE